jgi:hypothetical protein
VRAGLAGRDRMRDNCRRRLVESRNWYTGCEWRGAGRQSMIPPMVQWVARSWPFTLLAALMFTVGCAGEFQEPATPADYAAAEGAPAQAEPVYEQTAATAPADLTTSEYEDTDPSALSQWRDELSPYGVWVDDPTYGAVWVPSQTVVGADFAPYVSGGHWAMTADGDWLWESDYPFGWVTFHYGRWIWIPGRGWAWIAGRRYASAWVVWRTPYDGYDYVGWAPMPPYYYWSGGYAVSFWIIPPAPYVFCHSHYIFHEHWHDHMAHGDHVHDAATHTRPHEPAGAGRGGGAPSSGGGHRFAAPSKGPSLDAAHIPPGSGPKSYSSPNQRAWAAARPSPSSASSHALVRPAPSGSSLASRSAPASRPVYRGSQTTRLGPGGYAANGQSYRSPGSAPSYRGSPSYGSSPSYRTPSYSGSSSYRSSPSYSSPSYGSPSRSTPSYASPSYHSPSSSHGGGGRSYGAAPPPTYRPQNSGGGFSGGGGHRSSGGRSSGGGGRRH